MRIPPERAGCSLAAVLATAVGAHAQTLPAIPIDTFTLANGLEVIVSEDHSSPVVAIHVWYGVGSAHDPPGHTGLARLTEFLVRTATLDLAPGEHDRLVEAAGGVSGSFITQDVTGFWELLPASHLNLGLWLEAGRMRGLGLSSPAVAGAVQRVEDDRRRRDAQPFAAVQRSLDSLSTDYGPYRHRVLGSSADLRSVTVADVRAFYDRHFVPANAVLTVVGHVSVELVRELTERYFDVIPGGTPAPPLPPHPRPPRTDGERRARFVDAQGGLPVLYIAYAIPPSNHADLYGLTLLSRILTTGSSSRLHRRLVRDDRVAAAVFSGLNARRASGAFIFGALPNPGIELERLEAIVDQEVEAVVEGGLSRADLDRAINQVRAADVRNRLSVEGKAELLQRFRHVHGAAAAVNDEMSRFELLTVDQVLSVARTYLTTDNRAVVLATPEVGR